MIRKKSRHLLFERGGFRDRWLLSYTDMVTILLILFVSVAAQGMKARIPPPPAIVPRPASPTLTPRSTPRPTLVEAERKLKPEGLDVKLESRGLVISLLQSILFASGDDQVNHAAWPSISRIAAVMRENKNNVVLVGHADTTPIHNRRFRDNWQLSAARSLSLLALLTTQYGIPESRLSIESFGSNQPLGSNDTLAGRTANRRVEILILDDPASP